MLGALIGKLPRHRRWILCEHSLLLVVALPQPDALTTSQINRRPHLHGNWFRKFAEKMAYWISVET